MDRREPDEQPPALATGEAAFPDGDAVRTAQGDTAREGHTNRWLRIVIGYQRFANHGP